MCLNRDREVSLTLMGSSGAWSRIKMSIREKILHKRSWFPGWETFLESNLLNIADVETI